MPKFKLFPSFKKTSKDAHEELTQNTDITATVNPNDNKSNESHNIIIYKEKDGIIYGYLNQKALDLALCQILLKNTQLNKESFDYIQRHIHTILNKPISNGKYINKNDVLFDVGLHNYTSDPALQNIPFANYGTCFSRGIILFSNYSGFFKLEKKLEAISNYKKGYLIKDGDLLFTIKLADKPNEAETVIKTVKFNINLLGRDFIERLPNLSHVSTEFKVKRWLVNDFYHINEGDDIVELYTKFIKTNNTYDCVILKAPFSGILVQKANSTVHNNEPLYKIYPNEVSIINERFDYKFFIKKDDFTGSYIVDCGIATDNIIDSNTNYSSTGIRFHSGMYIYFNLEYNDGKYYFLLYYDKSKIKLDKLCSLHLLLDNGNVITMNPIAKPIRNSVNSFLFLCKFQMSYADIDEIETQKFIKWRIVNDEGITLVSKDVDFLYTKKISSFAFQKFIKDFKKAIKDNVPTELDRKQIDSSSILPKSCFVYLMVDTANNLHKIGISNNPKYREHTLQSEKPTIELLCAKEFPTRIIAEAIESALHKAYANKRIRGEWFNLDATDIADIKQTLK